ncbi:hypothetical protein DPMN_067025 [Dreissena polymorpha]|uniref:Uncharacterized protein n=1 Tax=Dreissena polymorpha TaxID=45954 RepID=A0A9D4BSH9_DREPO|nr:hypothetical protein DPMN_067025 [Dreissena polymorpha]
MKAHEIIEIATYLKDRHVSRRGHMIVAIIIIIFTSVVVVVVLHIISPFMQCGLSHPSKLDQFISKIRDV